MKSGTQAVESDRVKFFSAPPAARRPFALEPAGFEEMTVEHDRAEKVLWCRFAFGGRPSFTWAVFRDIARVHAYVDQAFAGAAAAESPIRWLVLGSRMPGVWNLGGDLELFARLIRAGDREALTRYARLACEAGYHFTTSFNHPLVTVSLVQGDALGGGFEAVLSSNLIVAERSAKFALPEILFNLFPGMGAYTFLARRIAPALAERMIMSGDTYSAEQLYQMGVVDVLADDGDGERAIRDYIGRHERRHGAHLAIYKARNVVNPVTLGEMLDITAIWVDAALRLEESDLRRMERLAAAQDRRRAKLDRG
jgi:DSF synthase